MPCDGAPGPAHIPSSPPHPLLVFVQEPFRAIEEVPVRAVAENGRDRQSVQGRERMKTLDRREEERTEERRQAGGGNSAPKKRRIDPAHAPAAHVVHAVAVRAPIRTNGFAQPLHHPPLLPRVQLMETCRRGRERRRKRRRQDRVSAGGWWKRGRRGRRDSARARIAGFHDDLLEIISIH